MFFLHLIALFALLLTQNIARALIIPRDGTTGTLPAPLRTVDCTTHVPEPIQFALNVTTFPGSLPPTLVCGELDVPMDYSKPIAADNQITVGFAMNRPQNPAGVILFHAGGPGLDAASAAWAIALNTSDAATFAGLEAFDFLAINTRGIQFSNPLNCSSNTFYNNVSFAFPSTQAEFDQYQSATSNFIQSCVQNSSPPGIVQHVGTAEVIQDWDAIRAALGYEQAHFVGVSYGTFVGAAYAAKFPNRVGRFILDAVLPHGMPFQDMITDQVAAINRLLLRADAFCIVDSSCPFHSQGKGAVVSAWQTLLSRALSAPLPAAQCGPGKGCNNPVTATDLRLGASVFLRSNPDFPAFIQALDEALNKGDASKFAYVPAGDIRDTVVVPLLCSDLKIDDTSFAAFQAFSTNANKSDPAQMVYSQIWQFALMCDAWPFDAPEPAPLTTNLPIMWVTSDFDLNLPTELTTFAFEHAPNSTLLIRHGDDHVSIDLPTLASHSLQIDFLRTGAFPAAQDNANVTVIPPGGKRSSTPPNPYAVPLGVIAGDFSTVETLPESVSVPSSAQGAAQTGGAGRGIRKLPGGLVLALGAVCFSLL
ncbi:Alpha/Beta hydrolase protein [Mycena amicta]|nr:Alpha/Beta hydrolase protein [Mycena amicta]